MSYTLLIHCEKSGLQILKDGHYTTNPPPVEFNKPTTVKNRCGVCGWLPDQLNHDSTVTYIELTPEIEKNALPNAPWTGSKKGTEVHKRSRVLAYGK